ncbi:hypothetical protein [Sanguibacter sp. Z1732]|uniref:hypothetical protein n=1 Tax=Sanguibacter sp. Z1732 TaxID=3435412 RepID=UPI003D9C9CED
MRLDIPRSVLVALWANRLGTAPSPEELAQAARAVRAVADDDGMPTADLLTQVAGTAVLAVTPVPGEPVPLPAPARAAALRPGRR